MVPALTHGHVHHTRHESAPGQCVRAEHGKAKETIFQADCKTKVAGRCTHSSGGGDFNCFTDPELDRAGGGSSVEGGAKILMDWAMPKRLMIPMEWRKPGTINATTTKCFAAQNHTYRYPYKSVIAFSRIVRWYLSTALPTWVSHVEVVSITAPLKTGHKGPPGSSRNEANM
ncbi:hypothetical protein PHYSODRAFT_297046 [Phytophthora sojae]|uniref:Uncharacterized protein n=1 Tax=Phytophthora sojae (strain P6497) TaxID=1094619 RepID=G4YSC2_PHYSP|nr:hypothetical protein PHYSODRAFT_297046 [Phytophthora sojae]EGZ25353.1 hypothetical protein PHYSODRAFT_297046 [Phytophthora sojae]|eukprot:XP_009520641.1 hypothetical protein PHYSODRAFT_297046 [Phytophthora sojae]